MISGDSKNDSRKILPKINWKTKNEENYPSIDKEQNSENLKCNTTREKEIKPINLNLKKNLSLIHI